jgi:hypothetical protein
MAVQAEGLEVVDEIVTRGDGGKEVIDLCRPLLAGLIELVGHRENCPKRDDTVPKMGH